MEVYRYIDDHRDEFISKLQEACRKQSIAAQNKGMAEMAGHMVSLMASCGIDARLIENGDGYPVVYGHKRGKSEKTLLFYNHYDVQPPDPLDEWISDPFSAEIRDGKIYARGVSDNKGNALARILAVKSLIEAEGELPCSVKFIIEGEEEIGSPNLRSFCLAHKHLLKADAGIWESGYRGTDGRPGIYSGVKGDVYLELEAHGANRDMHSAAATIIPNPAWRLVWALSTLKDEDENILVEGFYDNVVKPTPHDIRQIEEEPAAKQSQQLKHLGIDAFLLGLTGKEVGIRSLYSPTCTISGFLSGYVGEGQKTVLPRKAMAKVDFRLVPHQDPDDIERKIRRHLAAKGFGDIEVTSFTHSWPAYTPMSAEIVQIVRECAETVYQTSPHSSPWQSGSGPMSVFISDLGIPMTSFGVGYWGNNNHAPNENIRIEDYVLGIKMAAEVIRRFVK